MGVYELAIKEGVQFGPRYALFEANMAFILTMLNKQIFKKYLIVLARKIVFYNSHLANFLT